MKKNETIAVQGHDSGAPYKRVKNKSNQRTRAIAALTSAMRYAQPSCTYRACKLFTFVGVNRTCGSFLSPEARQRTVLRENSNNSRLSLHTPCRAGTLRKRKSVEIPGGREAVNTSQLIIEINHSGAGQARKKEQRTTIIQYVDNAFYSPADFS